MRGIDLSHWNKITNWEKLTSQDFIFQKCTEGTTYLDSTYQKNKAECLKRNIPFGAYHFARGGDVNKEADWFLKNIGEGVTFLVLDWEIEHPDPVTWTTNFLNHVLKATGKKAFLYTNDARARKHNFNKEYPLFIARYGVNNGKESTKPAFTDWAIWQYTSRGSVEGINGYVDLDLSNLTLEGLKKLTDTSYTTPSENSSPDANPEATTVSQLIKFSQNDPKWKNYSLGQSNLKMSSYGCTTCCISTLGTYFGEMITPGDLAKTKRLYTPGGLILWGQIETIYKTMRFLWRYYQFDERVVDEHLINNPNTVVLLQVNRNHWVSALNKKWNAYLCSDPYPYPARNKTYKHKEITGMAVLIRKD
jgi:GH25 family lysozyme M1 (1,4-beta-N-acetylmuramidase)